jgi:hypothetical protein
MTEKGGFDPFPWARTAYSATVDIGRIGPYNLRREGERLATKSESVDWKAEGWIVARLDLPRGFTEMHVEDWLPHKGVARRNAEARNVHIFDASGKKIGRCVAVDTNTKTAWVLPHRDLEASFLDEEGRVIPKRKLEPVPYERIEFAG